MSHNLRVASVSTASRREFLLQVAVFIVIIAAVFLTISTVRGGGIVAWFASSDLLTVSPSPVCTLEAKAGETVYCDFLICNPGKQSVTILGSKTTCSCTVLDGLPLTLTPGERHSLQLRVFVSQFDNQGVFEKNVELLINREGVVPALTMRVQRSAGM